MNMVFTYSYHTREYEDFADYDHSVSVVPYAMGPITSNIFYDTTKGNMAGAGLGMKTYTSDQAMDRAFNESEWEQYELRFSSDYDGSFNFTFGLFASATDSETNYNIGTPYMNYWSDVSTGPIGAIFPDAAPYGGTPFWLGWFQTLPVAQAQATQLVLAGLLPPADAQGFTLNMAKNGGVANANASIGPMHLAEWQQYFHVDSNLNRSSEAIYGEMYFDLSDYTTVTVGGRYTEFEINSKAFNSLLDLQNQGAGYYGKVKPAPIPRSYAAEESTYKLGIDHQLNEDQLLYATYSTGFKPGGFNTTDIEGLVNFDSEVANVFEVGLKSTLMEGALQLNVSAYTNDYEGLQLSQIVNRASINQNADVTIEGIEAEFTLLLSDTLIIDGFVSHTSTEIEDFQSVDPLNINQATTKLPLPAGATGFLSDFAPLAATCNPLVFVGQAAPSANCSLGLAASNPLLGALVLYAPTDAGTVFKSFGPLCTQPFFGLDSTTLPCPITDGVEADLSGNALPFAAELNYRLGVTKFVDTAAGSWAFRMDYSYRDDYYSTAFNRPRGHIEDVSLIDLSVKYTPVSEAWFVGAYVRNMTDEDHIYAYYSTDVTVGGFQNGVAIDPKIFGINFGMNF
jgi:outer membrane receptor protein involved in Fe transport